MPTASLLGNVSVVLVNTKTPGNIGAVARCMMNMGLRELILVRPPEDREEEAVRLAAGAEELILRAKRYPTLQEAVAEINLVVGTSRHASRRRSNIHSPREAAGRIVPLLAENKVALVFGREVNGLDNDDIALCHELIAIPSSDAFPSLNLSHAVMVVAYEFFVAALSAGRVRSRSLADAGEIERLFLHLQNALVEIGFLNAKNQKHMMFSLRQLLGRAQMDPREVSILRGILKQIQRLTSGKVL